MGGDLKCVDTAYCIDFLRGEASAIALAKAIEGEDLVIPTPVLVELLGIPFARGGVPLSKALQFVSKMRSLDITEDLALSAAKLGGECLKAGREKSAIDLMVAAAALELGCPVITRDKGFSEIPGLTVTGY